jgi:hypothetical protein
MRHRRALCLTLLCVFGLLCAAAPAWSITREYQIKEAFLYNFLKFVDWPNNPDPIVVGVLGHDPFEGGLKELEDHTVGGKRIVVRQLGSVDEARGVQAVFVSGSEAGRESQIVGALKGAPVLTVSDIPDFSEHGGIITLIIDNNRTRFKINTDSARNAHITVSSKLLNLATKVIHS